MAGNVFYVASSQELSAAYAMLSNGGGGTIYLKDVGTNYTVSLTNGGGTGPVKITSADPNNLTTISRINLAGVKNLTIDSVDVDSTGVARPTWHYDINIAGSSNVTIQNSTFTGNATGPYSGTQMETLGVVRGVNGFNFSNNTYSNYYHGLSVQETTNLTYSGNDVSQMQGDGLRLQGVQKATISGNTFHDFYGTPQSFNHNDMIQMWSTNAKMVSADVTISGNVFNSGAGSATQSILIGNEQLRSDPTHVYQNIKITDNLIYNGQSNGIQVNGANNVLVSHNTLLWNQDSLIDTGSQLQSSAPRILVRGVTNSVVDGNISSGPIAASGSVLKNNLVLNYGNPASANYVDTHFTNVHEGGAADIRDLRMLTNSPWNGVYGSSNSWAVSKSPDGTVDAVIRSTVSPADAAVYTFDGSQSLDADGYANESFYKYVWKFADGSQATGVKVNHAFTDTSNQDVTLSIYKNGTLVDTVTRSVDPVEKDLLKIDFDKGATPAGGKLTATPPSILDESSYQSGLLNVKAANAVAGAPGEGYAYQIGGSNKLTIGRGNEQIHSLDSFRLGFDIGLVKAGTSGIFLHFPQVMQASVTSAGVIKYSLTTDKGTFSLTSSKGILTDTAMHRVEIAYDSLAGKLVLYADGKQVASTAASGITAPQGSAALTFGNTWGSAVTARIDNIDMGLDSGLLSGSGGATAGSVATASGYSAASAAAVASSAAKAVAADTTDEATDAASDAASGTTDADDAAPQASTDTPDTAGDSGTGGAGDGAAVDAGADAGEDTGEDTGGATAEDDASGDDGDTAEDSGADSGADSGEDADGDGTSAEDDPDNGETGDGDAGDGDAGDGDAGEDIAQEVGGADTGTDTGADTGADTGEDAGDEGDEETSGSGGGIDPAELAAARSWIGRWIPTDVWNSLKHVFQSPGFGAAPATDTVAAIDGGTDLRDLVPTTGTLSETDPYEDEDDLDEDDLAA